MHKYLLSTVLGAVIAAGVFLIFVVPSIRQNNQAVGFNNGLIHARWEIATRLPLVLSRDFEATEKYETLYDVKTTTVVIVERTGIRTLRVRQ
jgi:uncharacterized membrane protein YciS (DUF1049 family)